MKINYTLKDGYINSFTFEPFDSKKPWVEIKEDDIHYLFTGKCKITKGKIDLREAEKAIHYEEYMAELRALYSWFSSYDIKAAQYNRQIRLSGESDIDIVALDTEAETKAARIRELRELLK